MKGYELFTKEKMIYLYKATKSIKYKKLRERIYFELSNHIDDMFCDYTDDGMSEEKATEKFLEEMGNPEDLCEELKKAHKDTLRFVKFIKRTAVFAVFVLIISIFGLFKAKDNLDFAKFYELPEETVKLEKSLATYTKLEYWSFPIDIYFYTNIDWYDIETAEPLYKVKEYDLFNDYYTLDESQSVLVDTFRARDGISGVFYVDDINKLPKDYYSDKWSEIVFSQYDKEKDTYIQIYPDLTSNEISELSKWVVPPDYPDDLKTEEIESIWYINFSIRDLKGITVCPDEIRLCKSIDGKYYIGWWDGSPFAEVPEQIAIKIDKAFEDAGI